MTEEDMELNGISYSSYDRENFEAEAVRRMDKAIKTAESEKRIAEDIEELSKLLKTLESQKRSRPSSSLNIEALKKDLRRQKVLFRRLGSKSEGLKPVKFKGIEEDEEAEGENESSSDEILETPETEHEKNVRIGEITSFGSKLGSESKSGSKGDFGQYLAEQISKNRRPKKRKPEKQSDDHYWNSSDSDWGSTDDELGDYSPKKRSNSKTATDDGDRDSYMRRVKAWKSSLSPEEINLNAKFENLQNGLKVPYKIWSNLYRYQKVSVQWLWELHQQGVGGILGDEMGLGKTIQVIAFLASLSYSRVLGSTLVVCPTTVMHQWVKECHSWWPVFRVAVLHCSGTFKGASRKSLITSITESKGILITSYNGIVAFKKEIASKKWDYVILDEGHKIRNPDAQSTLAVKSIPTPHRLILSGSPLQNNLKELWSLFDFVYPGKLGTLPVFMQEFSVPITQGGYANASRIAVATAFKCATILRDTISPYLLRRMKSDVRSHINLPEKNEQILFCKLTDEQRLVYRQYLDSGEVKNILDGRSRVFVGLTTLRKICNHPDLFSGQDRGSKYGYWRKSGKMVVVEALLKLWKRQGHRVLLFTQSRQLLTILESFVLNKGYSHMKLDGSVSVAARQPLIDKFNNSPEIFVFILTTKVGGLGVNLTGANRVVIFDPDWNPSTDTQARERAWRIGQKNDVTIYRLITSGTIEEKIYHRQIFKQFLVNRVLKDPKQRRFFKSNDLYELFTLNEGTSDRTESSAIFAGTGSEVRKRDIAYIKPSKKSEKKVDVSKTLNKIYQDDTSSVDSSNKKIEDSKKVVNPEISENKIKKHRHKRKKFEGIKVSHLVKTGSSKTPSDKDKEQSSTEQDNYVLSKLFKKSGVHSALKHDVIVDGGEADYSLIEQEADNVAKDAVRNLRISRRECLPADSGVPTWTGNFGGIKKKGYKFGSKAKRKKTSDDEEESNTLSIKSHKKMSSDELLTRINTRNAFNTSRYDDESLFRQSSEGNNSNEGIDILADIRNYVAFQAAKDGEATTVELVERFKEKLPPKQSPLFKALLKQICDFHRNSSGTGKWSLKSEFR